MEALRQAKQSSYNCQWWIKADGWDVQMASESRPFGMVLCTRCIRVTRQGVHFWKALVQVQGPAWSPLTCSSYCWSWIDILTKGAEITNEAYQQPLNDGNSSKQKMMDFVGFEELVKYARGFQGEIKYISLEGGIADTGVSLWSLMSNLLKYSKYSTQRSTLV